MATVQELWLLVEPLIQRAGFEIYDLEAPSSEAGVLRVFIWKKSGEGQRGTSEGVTLDDCAMISREIEEVLEQRGLFGDHMTLEVSSPGINRRLVRPEHFVAAIGERIRLKVSGHSASARGSSQPGRTIVFVGKLLNASGEALQVEEQGSAQVVSVAIADVRSAQVDFPFEKCR